MVQADIICSRYNREDCLKAAIQLFYAGGNYEEVINHETGKTKSYHYIHGGSGLAAVFIAEEDSAETDNLYYIHKDYLGSILALTNQEGSAVERYSFDAWGHRRNPTNWSQWQEDSTDYIVNRGFTGHEHMDIFGLINMNGRVYDPDLGRFISPDPYVQMPDNSQNFNRYTYALNNPLKYTDPSGEFIFTALCAIIPGAQPLLPIAIAVDIGGVVNTASNWKDITSNSDNFLQGLGRSSLYYAAGGINGGLATTGVGGAVGGGAVQSGMNAAIRGEDLDRIWKEAGIGGLSNLAGYGASAATSKLISKGLGVIGMENKIANKMISEGIGGAAGVYSVNVTNTKLRGAKWNQSFKKSFNWTVIAGGVYGATKGYFEATSPPEISGERYYDGHRESYYGDRVAPPDIPEVNLRLNLSQPKVMPPLRPAGHWETIWKWDDMNNLKKYRIWVEN